MLHVCVFARMTIWHWVTSGLPLSLPDLLSYCCRVEASWAFLLAVWHVHWHSCSAHVCTLMLMRLYGYSFLSSCCYYKTQFDSKLPDPLALTVFLPPTFCPFHNVPWVFVNVSIETGLYNSEYWLVELVFYGGLHLFQREWFFFNEGWRLNLSVGKRTHL